MNATMTMRELAVRAAAHVRGLAVGLAPIQREALARHAMNRLRRGDSPALALSDLHAQARLLLREATR